MKPELLSPAGDLESLDAAALYGADAVYVGGKAFGLRATAGLSDGDLAEAVRRARKNGVKVYLACNIIAENSDVRRFPDFIEKAAALGIDAVIVSDFGFFDIVKARAPGLPIHVSTQAGVTNYAACAALHRLGAKRVILAREVPVEEIKKIRDKTPPDLEIEVFVHGAMCVSFSGRCLLSAYMTGRNANKGECSHPCRWNYFLTEETRPNEFFRVFEDDAGSYILNSKDLCVIKRVGELKSAGVSSFKIEGRAKTAYYAAVITNAYRAAVDAAEKGEPVPDWALREVFTVSHRPYCEGFYFGEKGAQHRETGDYERDCDFIGTADGYGGGALEITQRNYFTANDDVEVVIPQNPPEKLRIREMYSSNGERTEIANRAMEKLRIPYEKAFPKGTMLRRINKPARSPAAETLSKGGRPCRFPEKSN
ncbi:MAG: U32 family peptidase [Oscillospiraceae bacterium]|jgi:putative protease|nr:U32 family peptidase [Oscillospiraceae bacterium]